MDFVCPIRLEGRLVAAVFSGQKRLLASQTTPGIAHVIDQLRSRAQAELRLDDSQLALALKNTAEITSDEIESVGFRTIFDVSLPLLAIASNQYVRRRHEIEHHFRRETQHYLEVEKDSKDGIKRVANTLRRLKQFMHLEQAYFLLNDVEQLDEFHISDSATKTQLTSEEALVNVTFEIDKLAIRDRISVFEITNKEKYSGVVQSLQTQLPSIHLKRVYIATCPLKGATTGCWLLINPEAVQGIREKPELSRHDKNFLSRYCSAARDVLQSALASSIVMRKISHELGAKLWQLYSREAEIAASSSISEIRVAARRNLSQLRRYQGALDNLKNVFLRRSKNTYNDQPEHLNKIVGRIIDSFDGDAEMETRGVSFLAEDFAQHDRLFVDEKVIEMAFYNIIENAVKYSFKDRYVEIRSRQAPFGQAQYCLEVVNFGVGILPDEITERLIFLEDYRGRLSRDQFRTGSGLGLALADKIVTNYGGVIHVKSIPAKELSSRKSEYAGAVKDVATYHALSETPSEGYLSRFSVFLPYSQTSNKP